MMFEVFANSFLPMLQVPDAASLLLERRRTQTRCDWRFAFTASAQEVGDPAGTRDKQVILRSLPPRLKLDRLVIRLLDYHCISTSIGHSASLHRSVTDIVEIRRLSRFVR